MVRVIRTDATEFIQQFRSDQRGLRVFQAVNNPVSDACDRSGGKAFFKPMDEEFHRGTAIQAFHAAIALLIRSSAVERQIRTVQSDPVHLAREAARRVFSGVVKREFDARRPAVDGQERCRI